MLTFALRQSLVPNELLRRVTSTYRLVGVGSRAPRALIGGFLAREWGLAAPFWSAAIVMAVIAFASVPFVNNTTVSEARGG